ncbi:hypothetical protein [Achromobacter sp.]|uniref:hypothetical protein n=1 Tax=Achromobacter sp. TaxID=134375 RepID=UPI003CFD798D
MNKNIDYEIPGDTEPQKMLWLAAAFAGSAAMIVRSLLENSDYSERAQGRVVAYLCRHATELYLKGAIGIATGKVNRSNHNIHNLYSEYESIYQGKGDFFFFEFPVEKWVTSNEDLFPETLVFFRKSHDQRFRYPADSRGTEFVGFEEIDIPSLVKILEKFSSALNIRAYFLGEHGVNAQGFLDSHG